MPLSSGLCDNLLSPRKVTFCKSLKNTEGFQGDEIKALVAGIELNPYSIQLRLGEFPTRFSLFVTSWFTAFNDLLPIPNQKEERLIVFLFNTGE